MELARGLLASYTSAQGALKRGSRTHVVSGDGNIFTKRERMGHKNRGEFEAAESIWWSGGVGPLSRATGRTLTKRTNPNAVESGPCFYSRSGVIAKKRQGRCVQNAQPPTDTRQISATRLMTRACHPRPATYPRPAQKRPRCKYSHHPPNGHN